MRIRRIVLLYMIYNYEKTARIKKRGRENVSEFYERGEPHKEVVFRQKRGDGRGGDFFTQKVELSDRDKFENIQKPADEHRALNYAERKPEQSV